jgi:hypothetical protein
MPSRKKISGLMSPDLLSGFKRKLRRRHPEVAERARPSKDESSHIATAGPLPFEARRYAARASG